MRISTIGLVFHSWMAPKGPYTTQVSTAALLSYNQNILTVFSTDFYYFQVFGSLQVQTCTQTCTFKYSYYFKI